MLASVSLIANLSDAHRGARMGSKAINLSRLIAARFAVPRGFVIGADAYRSHLWATGLRHFAAGAVGAEQREELRTAILSSEIPEDVWSSIATAYEHLSWQSGQPEPVVAVRASALEGNGSAPGFASAYESHLNISGLDDLKLAVRRVWASLWSGRAAGFRAALQWEGETPSEPAMAVIVQEMIAGQYSGTAATANPITGDPNRVLVMAIPAGGLAAQHEIDLADTRPSSDALTAHIVDQSILVEDVLGSRVEIEWLHDGRRLWILQAQPIPRLPVYFPTDGFDNEKPGWTRSTDVPVSAFSRSHLWSEPRAVQPQFPRRRGAEESRLVNGYAYRRRAPIDQQPDQPNAQRLLDDDIAAGLRLLSKWGSDVLPPLRVAADAVVAADLTGADHQSLLRALSGAAEISRSALDRLEETWYPSVRFPKGLMASLGGGPDAGALYRRLRSGQVDRFVSRDAALQELAEGFATAERSGRLDDATWWRDYKRDVDLFARQHGYAFACQGEVCDLSTWRGWIEDRDALFRVIGVLSRRGDRPTVITRHCARELDAADAQAEALATRQGQDRKRLHDLVRLSSGWLAMRAEAAAVCALACSGLRLVLMELARRLCEKGTLASLDDVFHLTLDELLELRADQSQRERAALAVKIAARKHELWLQRRLTSPDLLPAEDGATRTDSADTLAGDSVCPGAITARARVCQDIADAGDLEKGEILIVKSPMPAWTPFLGVAGGFIAAEPEELPLAALALDYGVPALVNCADAMSIATGQRITLNADLGTVDLRRRAL